MSEEYRDILDAFPKTRKGVGEEQVEEEGSLFAMGSHAFAVEQIKDLRHYRELRQSYSCKVYVFMCVWSGLMFGVLLLQGLGALSLGNAVLVTLAGGTTASVIGLVGFIVQGLFNSKGNGK